MVDWMERERMKNADTYNRGFNAGYEAGKKKTEEKEKESRDIIKSCEGTQ